jgi:5-methylcytosine-specific restriction endonuclease McrA
MKLDKYDALFSRYIRTRDNWTCQRCSKQYTQNTQGLHNSHFFGRTRKSVRFDEDNCIALCFGCHQIWDKEDHESYRAYKIKQLTRPRFDALVIRANTPQKPDYKMIELYYKEKLNAKTN